MNNLDFIFTRESVRNYDSRKITKEDLDLILKASMQGPSCLNLKDYSFIVIQNKDTLVELSNLIGNTAKPLLNATLAIVVLMDDSRAYKEAVDYDVLDSTIAAHNIMLAANALNIGSVMLGIYPQKERMEKIRSYFNLPSHIRANSIISLGYKVEKTVGKNHFEENRIHYEKW